MRSSILSCALCSHVTPEVSHLLTGCCKTARSRN